MTLYGLARKNSVISLFAFPLNFLCSENLSNLELFLTELNEGPLKYINTMTKISKCIRDFFFIF